VRKVSDALLLLCFLLIPLPFIVAALLLYNFGAMDAKIPKLALFYLIRKGRREGVEGVRKRIADATPKELVSMARAEATKRKKKGVPILTISLLFQGTAFALFPLRPPPPLFFTFFFAGIASLYVSIPTLSQGWLLSRLYGEIEKGGATLQLLDEGEIKSEMLVYLERIAPLLEGKKLSFPP
jgi:hypothetical protein